MATLPEAVNSIGNALKGALKRIESLEREVAELKRNQVPRAERVEVTKFPASDPLLDTSEEDAEFEDVG